MKKKEIRTVNISQLQTREAVNDQPAMISGYAAVFNTPTLICEGLKEVIMPGAFARAIAETDVRCLFDHDWSKVLGRQKSGTLRLTEDDRGLKFEVDLPNTSIARDLTESMSRGDINQCSFGFIPTKEDWDYNTDPILRTIEEVELYEVSIVTLPAYDDAEAALVRSRNEMIESVQTRKKLIQKIKGAIGNE